MHCIVVYEMGHGGGCPFCGFMADTAAKVAEPGQQYQAELRQMQEQPQHV
jgi:hypothetical protein